MLHSVNGAGRAAQSHQFAMDPTTDTMAPDGAVAAVGTRAGPWYTPSSRPPTG
jgi:hypothetical protein